MRSYEIRFLPLVFVALACSAERAAAPATASGSAYQLEGASASATLDVEAAGSQLAATMEFGQADVGSDFPPSADHDQSSHAKDKLVPGTVVIDRGGTVTFEVPAGVHQIAIYEPGKAPEDIDITALIPLCPGTAPRLINDTDRRLALITHSCGSSWSAQYTFTTPGRYLVICAFLTHFQIGMYGWVEVRDRA